MSQHNDEDVCRCRRPIEDAKAGGALIHTMCLGSTGRGIRGNSKALSMLIEALHRAGPDGLRFKFKDDQ